MTAVCCIHFVGVCINKNVFKAFKRSFAVDTSIQLPIAKDPPQSAMVIARALSLTIAAQCGHDVILAWEMLGKHKFHIRDRAAFSQTKGGQVLYLRTHRTLVADRAPANGPAMQRGINTRPFPFHLQMLSMLSAGLPCATTGALFDDICSFYSYEPAVF